MEKILNTIKDLSSVNLLNLEQLNALSAEIREVIKETAYNNGGHLSSSLGAVECITALCNVYDFEKDKILFDVGHQSYAYKILCRGQERFSTLRQKGGESGFPDCEKGDYFIGGHAGNGLSASLGLATARDLQNGEENIVCVVGDASFFNGESLEALFSSEKKPKKLVVVFNDNGMSISENLNGAYKFFTQIARQKGYKKAKRFLRKVFDNNAIGRFLRRIRFSLKRTLNPFSVIEAVGFKYYGVYNGHDLKALTSIFKEVKEVGKCAFVHIKTTKGKGYAPAEESSEKYHGVSSGYESSENTFSQSISPILCSLAEKNDKIVAVTAGMKSGTGLEEFANRFPKRFTDVGIAEEHAVTFATGMALGGLKPIVCIYSTFLQRSFDQVMIDACIQQAPVVFLLDRAGFVGSDGRTHQGLFDLSYLKIIPNLTLLAPKDCQELERMLTFAIEQKSPVAIRYPNGKNQPISTLTPYSEQNKWEILKDGSKLLLLAVGPRLIERCLKVASEYGDKVGVVNARSIKPLDFDMLNKYFHFNFITLEENSKMGGFGESVVSYLNERGYCGKISVMAVNDIFVSHGSVSEQLEECGFGEENLKRLIEGAIC